MSGAPEMRRGAGSLGWFSVIGGWLGLFHLTTTRTWGHGKTTFLWLGASLLLLFLAKPIGRLFGNLFVTPITGWIAAAGLLLLLGHLTLALQREVSRPGSAEGALDIGANTYVAGTLFLEGKNPYRERVQPHKIEAGPHVEIDGDRVTMFGIPYTYGFPYLPAMFISYLPFRGLAGGMNALRAGNGILLLANLAGLLLLVRRLAAEGLRTVAGIFACVAYLGLKELPVQMFVFGITDLVMATFALYAFVALSDNRMLAAGILLGLCQACKFLPGPLLVVPVLLWLYGKPGFRAVAIGYAATTVAVVLPFALWSPRHFLSSTLLFYITHHGGGDSTSLWFFLPEALRTPFSLIGLAITAALALVAVRTRGGSLTAPLALGYASYLSFMAFAPMTHLNYIWGIYPLGCAALALRLASGLAEARAALTVHDRRTRSVAATSSR